MPGDRLSGKYDASQTPIGTGFDESPSEIRDGLTRVEQNLAEIHAVISFLEARLGTVLRPQPPASPNVSGGGVPSQSQGPPISHVQERVRSLSTECTSVFARLRELAARVEV